MIQQKTKKHGKAAYLKIEVSAQLKAVLRRCKDDIVSPYVIHRLPERRFIVGQGEALKTKSHHTQITASYLSHAFAKAREASGLFDHLSIDERPSFHEIRSLGIVLYEQAGIDPQTLAGHTRQAMTDQYKQGHDRIQWTSAKANLELDNC